MTEQDIKTGEDIVRAVNGGWAKLTYEGKDYFDCEILDINEDGSPKFFLIDEFEMGIIPDTSLPLDLVFFPPDGKTPKERILDNIAKLQAELVALQG